MNDPQLDGWRRLACAVLVQAAKDIRQGNGHSLEAWAFLSSDGAADLVDLLELDAAGLGRVLAGLPDLAQPALPGIW